MGNILFGGTLLLGPSCKVPYLAYALYVCLNLYGVMLHLDGYATHFFRDAIICSDDYYMQNSSIVGI